MLGCNKCKCFAGAASSEATAPSKEEFLQFGVEHGGNLDVLARGLNSCREGTIKEITYKVLLHTIATAAHYC